MAALVFSIHTRDPGSYARTGTLKLAHGEVRTPAFVPLATKAVVKTLEVREAGALGLYLTGRAATLAGRGKALTPSDVLSRLPDALAERGDGTSDLALPFVIFDLDPAR